MNKAKQIDISALSLPDEPASWIDNAPIYESSGESGAKTIYIGRGEGAYLKIADRGLLYLASKLQTYFAYYKMSSPVLRYLSADKDYLLTAPLKGEDGTSDIYLSNPWRLSEVFGRSLRLLHDVDMSGCPVKNKMASLLSEAASASFSQSHLDDIADYIGAASAGKASAEIAASGKIVKNDVLIHGDYCLPNIILNDWKFQGFVDVADGGTGDRHYDLAWGLWTLKWNLKSSKYGQCFLDSYGRSFIDKDRLRVCGLLSAME